MVTINLSEENYIYLKEIIKGSVELLQKQRVVNKQQLYKLIELNKEVNNETSTN